MGVGSAMVRRPASGAESGGHPVGFDSVKLSEREETRSHGGK